MSSLAEELRVVEVQTRVEFSHYIQAEEKIADTVMAVTLAEDVK